MKQLPKSLQLAFAFFILINVSAANLIEKDVRKLPKFSKISLRISGNVYVKQGNTQSVELKGDWKDIEKVITEVNDNKLTIKSNSKGWKNWGNWSSNIGDVDIYITVKDINALSVGGSGKIMVRDAFETDDMNFSVSGSGRIIADKTISGNDFKLSVSGSGRMTVNIDGRHVESHISGSGRIEATGTCRSAKVSISGSGRFAAENLITEDSNIHISGSGGCTIHVNNELDAHLSGSGNVRYNGNPKNVNKHTSGSGSVHKM